MSQRIPDPDYDAHAAYGGTFAEATAERRQEALDMLVPHLKKLWDTESKHMGAASVSFESALKNEERTVNRRRGWRKSLLNIVGSSDVRGRKPRMAPDALSVELEENGIVGFRLTAKEKSGLRAVTTDKYDELIRQRKAIEPERRGVGASSITLAHVNKRECCPHYAFFEELLRKYCVFELAEGYLGQPVTMKFAILQTNTALDSGIREACSFEDLPLARTYYMHIDSTLGTMKVIIYRNQVDQKNGAFRYIPGSNLASMTPFEKCVRKASDKAGLDSTRRDQRELFFALPLHLRRKANFGNDLLDGTPESEELLAREKSYTSDDGDLIFFDNNGIHRGAILEKGERQIIQILLVS